MLAAAQVWIGRPRDLQSGFAVGDIPVGVAAVKRIACDHAEPPQTIVVHGQGIAAGGGHGVGIP